MKAWRMKWMRAMVSVVCYTGLAILSVLTTWLTSIGKDGFNQLVHDPKSNPFEWFGLGLSIAGVVFTTVKSLMNRDWPKEEKVAGQ